MAGEVTSGNELNQYTGNAGLAGGPGAAVIGVSESDFTPLQTYALKRYETNLIDYETQEKDRAKLEEQLHDPLINVPLDENYAMQIRPQMEEFKNLMAKNPSAYKDPKTWYKIQNLDKELIQNNAKLKTVQTLKDKYKGLAGSEADEAKKKNYEDYVAKLDGYKLGDDVPKYNDYFPFDKDHLESPEITSTKTERLNPKNNTVETVSRTIVNPIGLYEKQKRRHLADGKVNNSGADLARTALSHGGLEDLNNKMATAYQDALKLNFGLLHKKYDADFAEYQKKNPQAKFTDFLLATGKEKELTDIDKGLAFLKEPLTYIKDDGGNNPQLNHTFTYDENGVRLNADNDKMLAIYSALNHKIGVSEEVVGKASTIPSTVSKNIAAAGKLKSDALVNVRKQQDRARLTTAQIAKLKGNEQDTEFDQLWQRNPQEQKSVATLNSGKITSTIPWESSLPVYTITDGRVTQLRPIGAKPVYSAYDTKGKPTDKAKIVGYEGGSYNLRYVSSGSNNPISDDKIMAAYNAAKSANAGLQFDDFIKQSLAAGHIDYVMEGANGIVDRKLALSAQKILSNKNQKKGQDGIFDYTDDELIPSDNTDNE